MYSIYLSVIYIIFEQNSYILYKYIKIYCSEQTKMGFDEGRIILESPNGTYYPGQTVKGKLVFHQEKEKTFRGK